MYLGPFYFQKRDLFIILTLAYFLGVRFYHLPLPFFDHEKLLMLALLFLFAKSSILPSHDPAVFITFFTAIMLTLFFPLFQVIVFLITAFFLQKILKVY